MTDPVLNAFRETIISTVQKEVREAIDELAAIVKEADKLRYENGQLSEEARKLREANIGLSNSLGTIRTVHDHLINQTNELMAEIARLTKRAEQQQREVTAALEGVQE